MQDPWCPTDPLRRRAVTTPDRTALVDLTDDGEAEWSDAALDSLVERTAADLRAHLSDLPRQPRVGLALSPRLGFVATLYATLRLGWTAVLLDPEMPGRKLDARVEQTDTAALVCEAGSEPACREAAVPALSLDASDTVPALLDAETGPDGPATGRRRPSVADQQPGDARRERLVLFTSGTTGTPKAVGLTARNLFSSAVSSAFRLGVTPDDRWLGCLPVHHMGGLAPVFRSAWYGTTLVLQGGFDAGETGNVLAAQEITGVSLVPTQLRRLLASGWSPSDRLRTVLLGGAPAGEELVDRALDAGVPVHPTYGLTEAASQVTTARPAALQTAPGTVGRPLLWTDVRIVADGEPVDPGQQGEIVVDGPTVTPGYLDRSATAEAFSEWGLHTGDLGVRDDGGRLWVRGRLDDVINTGGELVAPDEVVAGLEAHPGVEEAAVVGLADDEWGERVGALVVPTDDSVSGETLRDHCRDRLANHKLPRTIATAAELPRTASGTVDREAVAAKLRSGD